MLVVRSHQVVALDEAQLASFHRRLAAHVAEVFPGDDSTSAIGIGIARARGFGLTSERDVARFVDLLVGIGDEFPDLPETTWARAILEGQTETAATRLDQIYQRLAAARPDLAPLWRAWA